MAAPRTIIALDHDRLCAVQVAVRRGAVAVQRGGVVARPDDVDPLDAEGLGAWMGTACGSLGVATRHVTIAVPRDEHVSALIDPPDAALSAAETVGLVRHTVARASVPLDDEAAVDFVHLPGDGAPILGVGLPGARVAWYRELAGAAKFGRCRLEPWSAGAAATTCDDDAGLTRLIIAIGERSAHVVLSRDGTTLFARRVSIPASEGGERLAIEALRTISGFRAGANASLGEPVSTLVIGPEALADATARASSIELGLPVERGLALPGVKGMDRLAPGSRWALASLVGLAIAESRGHERHDLFAPREAPDESARTRQAVLAAGFVLIATVGVVFVVADGRSRALDQRIDARSEALGELREELEDLIVRGAKAEHASAYLDARPNWSDEFAAVAGAMPGPESALLDMLSGRAEAELEFQPGENGSFRGRWSSDVRTDVRLAGQTASRDAALALREALIEGGRFRVRSRGADTDDRFDLELDGTGGGGDS